MSIWCYSLKSEIIVVYDSFCFFYYYISEFSRCTKLVVIGSCCLSYHSYVFSNHLVALALSFYFYETSTQTKRKYWNLKSILSPSLNLKLGTNENGKLKLVFPLIDKNSLRYYFLKLDLYWFILRFLVIKVSANDKTWEINMRKKESKNSCLEDEKNNIFK